MSTTGVVCPRCGTMASTGQRFCMECGCALQEDQGAKTQVMGTVATRQVSQDASVQSTGPSLPFKKLAPLIPLSDLDGPQPPEEPQHQAHRVPNGVRTTPAKSGRQPIQLTPITLDSAPVGNVSATVVYEDGSETLGEQEVPRSEVRNVRTVPLAEMDGEDWLGSQVASTVKDAQVRAASSDVLNPSSLQGVLSEDDPDDPDSPTVSFDDEPGVVLVRCSTRETYELELPAVVGKGTKAQVVISGNRHISRTHACISRADGEYVVEDLQSANGTYINERRLAQGAVGRLSPGDVLRLANEEFEFLVV